jgi:hypothetical protein
MIKEYNKIVFEIVLNFTKRFYKELYDEEADELDFDINNYC